MAMIDQKTKKSGATNTEAQKHSQQIGWRRLHPGRVPLQKFLIGAVPQKVPEGLWVHLSGYRLAGRALLCLWGLVILCILLKLMHALAIAAIAHRLITWIFLSVIPVWLIVCAIMSYTLRSELRRFAMVLQEADYLVCLNCGFRLFGLSPRGRCPECGGEYEAKTIRSTWTAYVQRGIHESSKKGEEKVSG